ncbi:MAG: ABC transporter substrate-binding protein [Hyphomicrobiales bacterium]|nr:ABC transporter substrate-binding protein [Hyphomicrobiales bacterium]
MSAIILSIALRQRITAAVAATLGLGLIPQLATAQPMHGLAMHGEPALPADYQHLPYADPDAPKGGSIGLAGQGTFDSLNPFILKGTVPDGLWGRNAFWPNNLWDSLMVRNWDEPFTLYGHIAEFVETPDDRSWVEFTINPLARFSDGEPVTPEDVAFSFELLKDKGLPREWHKKIDRVEVKPGAKVRFVFGEDWDREMPLLIGLLPVFPKHAVDPETFGKSGLAPPPGSGPYQVSDVKAGSTIKLTRNPEYWARDLPQKRGFDNFDEIRIEYFRDGGTLFEAFRKGLFDVMTETNSARWTSEYDFPAVREGKIVLDEFVTGTPKGMNGFVFNQRRPMFSDPQVREAFSYFLDFQWINRNLYAGAYARTGSYFQGSGLSSLGVDASDDERALLAQFPNAVRADVMDGTYAPPESDGSGRDRANFRRGLAMLSAAGWEQQDGKLVNAETGEAFVFEFLARNKEEERLALALQRSLALIGVEMTIRTVDASQYWERILNTRDFDMIHWIYGASLSPGNEQLGRWSKVNEDTYGRLNFAGVSEPAVDAMISALLSSRSLDEFITAVRAYDRVLISGFHVIPLYHSPAQWIATRGKLQKPANPSISGATPASWWSSE